MRFVATFMLTLAACAVTHGASARRSVVDQVLTRVLVRVSCRGIAQNVDRIGHGVAIDENHIVTAAHVVACTTIPRVVVEWEDGSLSTVDVSRDLAMFGDGTDLAVLFYPGAWHVTPAIVSDEWWGLDDEPSRPGDSGSPVYNNRGELVGVVQGIRDGRRSVVPLRPHLKALGLR